MNALLGLPPGDDLHDTHGSAVAWLRAHFRADPKHMIPVVAGMIDRIAALEVANAVAAQALAAAEGRAVNAESHNARLRIEVAKLKTKLIEGEKDAENTSERVG